MAERCRKVFVPYEGNVRVMYPKESDFTYENRDWYQLGVMLNFCLLNDDKKPYHEMELKFKDTVPISTLLKGILISCIQQLSDIYFAQEKKVQLLTTSARALCCYFTKSLR